MSIHAAYKAIDPDRFIDANGVVMNKPIDYIIDSVLRKASFDIYFAKKQKKEENKKIKKVKKKQEEKVISSTEAPVVVTEVPMASDAESEVPVTEVTGTSVSDAENKLNEKLGEKLDTMLAKASISKEEAMSFLKAMAVEATLTSLKVNISDEMKAELADKLPDSPKELDPLPKEEDLPPKEENLIDNSYHCYQHDRVQDSSIPEEEDLINNHNGHGPRSLKFKAKYSKQRRK